ncbi:hypothetical protein KF840_04985 [bacterium]|nr:hypothetical protein [bacterium]
MRAGEDWRSLTTALAARLRPHGLDIVHPFAAAGPDTAAASLPDLGRGDPLGLLIGNTRALWAPFVAAWRKDAALRAAADPLERYVEAAVLPALAALGVRHAVRWAHDPPPRLAIQGLADRAGLAPLSPVGLNVHPVYGPWFALRAAAVLDIAGPAAAPPLSPPCAHCAATCAPAFARARAAQQGRDDIGATWPLWLAVRDACPIGRVHRYGEAQIRYHYARDRTALDTRAGGPPR